MKTYKVTISNEANNYTDTKYNNTLTGFTSEEAASKAAKEALRDAAGELMKWDAICYIETLNAWVLANNGHWLLVAKIEATETEQPETKAPEFSELSHAATNIVLAAENTQSIYAAHVEPLLRSLERKAAKGVTLSLDTLAKSYAMAAIVRESIKEVKRTSYDPFSANADDRRAAALYLADIYIGDL